MVSAIMMIFNAFETNLQEIEAIAIEQQTSDQQNDFGHAMIDHTPTSINGISPYIHSKEGK